MLKALLTVVSWRKVSFFYQMAAQVQEIMDSSLDIIIQE
jgi:hypothetical protein